MRRHGRRADRRAPRPGRPGRRTPRAARAGSLLAAAALLLAACGDTADREEALERAVEAPDRAPVAAEPADEPPEIPRVELGALDPDDVVIALPWRSERLDRGERRPQPVSREQAAPAEPADMATLEEVRVARGDGWDRIVFEFRGEGSLPAYHLDYVSAPFPECATGRPLLPGGEGWLFVQLLDTRAHDDAGESTIVRDARAPALPNLKEVHLLCDQESTVEWVLALTDARPFRVIEARDPVRIVVDVQH